MSKHELVLVLDARVDEIAEQAPLDAVVRLSRIIDWPVGQATADQPVSIIATARLTLACNRLATRIDAAHVRADGAAQTPGIAGAIRIHVFEIVQLLGWNFARRAIGFRRQFKRNAIAPATAHLGGEQFRIDFVFVRLKKIFKPDDVRLDHLEHGEASVQTKLARLRHQIIFSVIPQHKQPGLARLLVIRRISLGATVNGGQADAVGIAEVNLEGWDRFAVFHLHQRHSVGTPNLPKGVAF